MESADNDECDGPQSEEILGIKATMNQTLKVKRSQPAADMMINRESDDDERNPISHGEQEIGEIMHEVDQQMLTPPFLVLSKDQLQ